MRNLYINIALTTLIFSNLGAKVCSVPPRVAKYLVKSGLDGNLNIADIRRNSYSLSTLCTSFFTLNEGSLRWRFLLVTNPKKAKGLFWFLPHDNENSAFSSAIYATIKYGGGFLAIVNNDKRYNMGQDPNRNFSNSTRRICKGQKAASPIYTNFVFNIIDYYKTPNTPYLALHNNRNRGGVSILKSSSKVRSFLAYKKESINSENRLTDEDNLIYMASTTSNLTSKIGSIIKQGLNVKLEVVNSNNNDCSMSNYIVIEKGDTNYYNIEAEHRDSVTQKRMIDILLKVIY